MLSFLKGPPGGLGPCQARGYGAHRNPSQPCSLGARQGRTQGFSLGQWTAPSHTITIRFHRGDESAEPSVENTRRCILETAEEVWGRHRVTVRTAECSRGLGQQLCWAYVPGDSSRDPRCHQGGAGHRHTDRVPVCRLTPQSTGGLKHTLGL